MYALQTVQADVLGTTGCTLLFKYPLDNTWTYKTAIEPLGKNHRMCTPWPDVHCFSGPINSTLPPSYFSPFSYAPRLPECFQPLLVFSERVCEAFVGSEHS
jgi:hypothetical protein